MVWTDDIEPEIANWNTPDAVFYKVVYEGTDRVTWVATDMEDQIEAMDKTFGYKRISHAEWAEMRRAQHRRTLARRAG